MKKEVFRRAVSYFVACTLLISSFGFALTWRNGARSNEPDPFSAMVSQEDTAGEDSVEPTAQLEESAGVETAVEAEKAGRTSRYIVKYKTSGKAAMRRSRSVSPLAESASLGSGELELITLDEAVSPEEFAEELRNQGTGDYIEYIQPDYILSVSNSEPVLEEEQEQPAVSENEGAPEGEEDTAMESESDGEAESEEEPAPPQAEENGENQDAEMTGGEEANTSSEEENVTEDETLEEEQPEEEQEAGAEEEQPPEDTAYAPVTVAIIDTGVDISHPRIEPVLWINEGETGNGADDDGNGYVDDLHGYDFAGGSGALFDASNPSDSNHGTQMAGIVASLLSEEQVPVSLMLLRVFDNGVAYTSDVLAAIAYAEANGAKIANMSFGCSYANPALEEAVANSPLLFVCAAGNFRSDLAEAPVYPAAYDSPNVVSVACTNADDGLSYFSNYGAETVTIAARGRNIVSALPQNQSGMTSGTSASAAYVTGCAALAAAKMADVAAADLKSQVTAYGDRLSSLQDKVIDGRRASYENILAGVASDQIIAVSPADDFDVSSYRPLDGSAAFELFSSREVVDCAAGLDFCIAVLEDGTVWTWGDNTYGQLGNGTTVSSASPVQVIGITNAAAVAAGDHQAYMVTADGILYAWGRNDEGQLGIGSVQNQTLPVQVFSQYCSKVDAGGNTAAALLSNCVYVWGSNSYGQLGLGSSGGYQANPEEVAEIAGISDISVGQEHMLAIDTTGYLWVWGKNDNGQLGDGTEISRSLPYRLSNLSSNVTKIDAGGDHSLVVYDDMLYGAGGNDQWQLGVDNESIGNIKSFIQVGPGAPASFAAGYKHTVTAGNGLVNACGSNGYGQLGCGEGITRSFQFLSLPGITGAKKAAAGPYCTLVIDGEGKLWYAGGNSSGQRGFQTLQSSPCQITDLQDVVKIAAGDKHAVALHTGGYLSAWGDNSQGQVGVEDTLLAPRPVSVPTAQNVTNISADGTDNFAITGTQAHITGDNHGTYIYQKNYTWGNGNSTPTQQLGNIDLIEYVYGSPHHLQLFKDEVRMYESCSHNFCNAPWPKPENPIAVCSGNNYAFALSSDGTVWVWGDSGKYGIPGATSSSAAQQHPSLSNISSIAYGNGTSFAVGNDGKVYSWSGTAAPTQLAIDNVKTVSAGYDHVLLLKEDATVWAYGGNSRGQLGRGTQTATGELGQVALLTDVISVKAGKQVSYAVKSDGSVLAWGDNTYGQLGDGNASSPYHANRIGLQQAVVSTETAKPLGAVTAAKVYNGTVDAASREDYLRFQIDSADIYQIRVEGVGVSADLLDEQGEILTSFSDPRCAVWIDRLPAQSYTLKIHSPDADAYRLSIDALNQAPQIIQVSAGSDHSLALQADGSVWAFGRNDKGQLGDGTTDNSTIPTMLQTISDVRAVTAGKYYSLAVKRDGTVWGWGENSGGMLSPIAGSQPSPVQIPGLTGIVEIQAASEHAVALRNDGTVWSWGSNTGGQLGDGTADASQEYATQVIGLSQIRQISSKENHALALKADGTVWAWGENDMGQLGDGTTADSALPKLVEGLPEISFIAAGTLHSIAISKAGEVYVWGNNTSGQLGLGNTQETLAPTKVPELSGMVSAAADSSHTILVSDSREVYTAGSNGDGRLGRSDAGLTFQKASGAGVVSASAGGWHSLIVQGDGAVGGWGGNSYGQLGDSTTQNASTVSWNTQYYWQNLQLRADKEYRFIIGKPSLERDWSCELPDGEYTFRLSGAGVTARLLNTDQSPISPTFQTSYTCPLEGSAYFLRVSATTPQIYSLKIQTSAASLDFADIAAGKGHGLAVEADGKVWSWGENTYGQLGLASENSATPMCMDAFPNKILRVGAGDTHSLAVDQMGNVYAWGNNANRQLGPNVTGNQTQTPTLISSLSNIEEAEGGASFSVARNSSGQVYTWGNNTYGQLGNNTTTSTSTPQCAISSNDVIRVSAGGNFALALKKDGTVWSWGQNTDGQLGRYTSSNNKLPAQISGLGDIVDIAAGERHALALQRDGTVWAWGCNDDGELGNANAWDHYAPVQVLSGAQSISAGAGFSVVIMEDGTAKAFGENSSGQLGLGEQAGTGDSSAEPAEVVGVQNACLLECGYAFTMLLTEDGKLYVWGDELIDSFVPPAPVAGMTDVKEVAAGNGFSIAVKNDGTAWHWGYDLFDENISVVVTGGSVDTPTQIQGMSGIISAAAGMDHALLLKNDGTVWAWGLNCTGEVGDNTTTMRPAPVQVTGLSDVVAIAAGAYHSLALKEDGTVWSWGSNSSGNLGLGDTQMRTVPTQVTSLTTPMAMIASGDYHSMAAAAQSSTAYFWGNNGDGQLGDNTTANKMNPTPQTFGGAVQKLSGGYRQSVVDYAPNNDLASRISAYSGSIDGLSSRQVFGSVASKAVSYAGSYQALLRFPEEENKIVVYGEDQPPAYFPAFRDFAIGEDHVLAITEDDTLWSWGGNGNSQLGHEANGYYATPVEISKAFQSYDSFANAYDAKMTHRYSGAIIRKNQNQYVKFHIGLPGNYTVTLVGTKLVGNLYDSAQEPMTDNRAPADRVVLLSNTALTEGDYYLEVGSALAGTYELLITPQGAGAGQNALDIHANVSYDFRFKASDITSFAGSANPQLVYTLKYAPSDLELVTLCMDAAEPVKQTGLVAGTDIEILEFGNGTIRFRVNRELTSTWSGTVNTIRFRGIRETQSKIQVTAE